MATDPALPIIYVRHGETDWNAQGLIQGSIDTELNANENLDRLTPYEQIADDDQIPAVEKLACELAVAAFVNVTVPGPLNLVHATVRMLLGRPSSDAVPVNVAVDGSVMV